MAQLIANDRVKLVAGLGVTGLSVARYLTSRNELFVVADSRQQPPQLDDLRAEFPQCKVLLGEFNATDFCAADEVFLSPGLPRTLPAVKAAIEADIPVINDIELFARESKAPIVAITGSNGKSTVTTLVGRMFSDAGKQVGVGGNLGVPALELLQDGMDGYVLELSSFQLESVVSVKAAVAVVLNVTEDHLDYHGDLPSYHSAKHRIFRQAKQVVVNRDDPLTVPLVSDQIPQWSFGLSRPDKRGVGVSDHHGESWLFFEFEPLMPVSELSLPGEHNIANALAALAIGCAMELPMASMLSTLRTFSGLPHRCQLVRELRGVSYINDSKATNVGAALAAIEGLAEGENILLIAGGEGKDQNFAPLINAMSGRVRALFLLGAAAPLLESLATEAGVSVTMVDSLDAAVVGAAEMAVEGGVVLLSPACASLDMFRDYQQRGDSFVAAVESLS